MTTNGGKNTFNVDPKLVPNDIAQLKIIAISKFIIGLYDFYGCLEIIRFFTS